MLSKDNFEKLNMHGLYRMHPGKVGEFTYWCKNWTFVPRIVANSYVLMCDTYYGDTHCIPLDDKNYGEFIFVFDFDKVVRVPDNEVDEYDESDLYCAATDSGGSSCGHLYWRNKDSKKSVDKQIEKLETEIRSLKCQIEWKQCQLDRLHEQSLV